MQNLPNDTAQLINIMVVIMTSVVLTWRALRTNSTPQGVIARAANGKNKRNTDELLRYQDFAQIILDKNSNARVTILEQRMDMYDENRRRDHDLILSIDHKLDQLLLAMATAPATTPRRTTRKQ